MDDMEVILYGIIIFTALLVVGLIVMDIYVNDLCEQKCGNALAYEVYKSGNLSIDDVCVCFYQDKIRAFKLG